MKLRGLRPVGFVLAAISVLGCVTTRATPQDSMATADARWVRSLQELVRSRATPEVVRQKLGEPAVKLPAQGYVSHSPDPLWIYTQNGSLQRAGVTFSARDGKVVSASLMLLEGSALSEAAHAASYLGSGLERMSKREVGRVGHYFDDAVVYVDSERGLEMVVSEANASVSSLTWKSLEAGRGLSGASPLSR